MHLLVEENHWFLKLVDKSLAIFEPCEDNGRLESINFNAVVGECQLIPKHPDAIGYMNDLAKEINESWFVMVCDLAAMAGVATLDQFSLDTLSALYCGRASYIRIKPAVGAIPAAAPPVPVDFLKKLSRFSNFKLLCDSLEVTFEKRVTLVFGANGSGKSSLCESLKVLATPGLPNRPLENVRAQARVPPSFVFQFQSDTTPQTWTPAAGYGPRQTTVKYFDTAIAIQNVTNAVEPGRIIVLAPFKLHIFEWAKALTTNFREALQRDQRENALKLNQALEGIRSDFAKFKTRPLAVIEEGTVSTLEAQIKLGEDFEDQELLRKKLAAVAELEKALSEEGLKLLRVEIRELESLLTSVDALLTSAEGLWVLKPVNKDKSLLEKRNAQQVVIKKLIPPGSILDDFLDLLRSASRICKLDEAKGSRCPLCKRDLEILEVNLFNQYHTLLVSELEKEINALRADLSQASELATAVGRIDRKSWDKFSTIPEEILSVAKTNSDIIVANCDISKEPAVEGNIALLTLRLAATNWAKQLESKKTTIEAAVKGRDELVRQLMILQAEIEPLEYAQAIADRLEALKAAQTKVAEATFWNTKLPSFTHVLKRITERAKNAHEELVVADFEARLNAEYKALAEKDMAAFGVRLAKKGTDATVTVLPQVGGKGLEGVLSEGEQRLHALALFFAELETCPSSVLVFDDPVSSFDYNYITNYCVRVRDFAVKYPDRQIIVLTHNWEFFVQLQTTINQANLKDYLAVHVLENCAVVADYSEKLDILKNDIDAILLVPGEPTKSQKEELASKMRRLIEAVVNSHVFNNERHQYKQKNLRVTVFHKFTKIVALLPAEATTLSDLYAKLSITGHDDPRTDYVNTDKAMFQTRYSQILTIETAIKGSIPQ